MTDQLDALAGLPDGYPYGEFDAMKWAEEFIRIHGGTKIPVHEDDGLLLGWFANAIMTGYDRANSERDAAVREQDALREAPTQIRSMKVETRKPVDSAFNAGLESAAQLVAALLDHEAGA